jgi:hypothetical protein
MADKPVDKPELMNEINKTAARITLNGRRHYTTPLATGPAPSVTTIISQTASEANKKKLEMWSKANPGVKEKAAERGTAIHYGMECYLKGDKSPEIPSEYAEFWEGMPKVLDQFSEVLWAESPVLDKFNFTIGSDDVARVWGCDYPCRPQDFRQTVCQTLAVPFGKGIPRVARSFGRTP